MLSLRTRSEIVSGARSPGHVNTAKALNKPGGDCSSSACLRNPDRLPAAAPFHLTQGKFEEANLLFERALSRNERAFGPDHPTVATDLNSWVVLLAGQVRVATGFRKRSSAVLISCSLASL